MNWLLFILGAMVAGFVQGLTGFAFALVAMSFWVWALSPQLAAPLVVFASVWSHIISLPNEPKTTHLKKALYLPYLIAGLIGVPLGTWLLNIVEAETFRILLGIFLVIWCPLMLLNPKIKSIQHSGKTVDASIGLIGGVLGGLGGFCGSVPSAWLMLKQLPKEQQRYILRHFNFAIQVFTLAAYLLHGTLNQNHLPYLAILILAVSIPAILGARLFHRISEQRFKQIVLGLLFSSGCFLLIKALMI
ncbi:sulfite exporter TauE/SafE family protein [Acinetobacter thermotolerans]|uniref:sulfite exporter TauE/SafE family protein n=1 Tax=Acinetobacter thermotolerans TaxID=3151487 RepID=UPI00325B06BB